MLFWWLGVDDIRWRFVCCDKTEPVSTLLWFFAILSPRRCAVIACWVIILCLCFCLGRVLSCTVVADVACLGASLCVYVGVLLGFNLHF